MNSLHHRVLHDLAGCARGCAQDRTSAGMWDTLELPAYAQQPKKVYNRDDDADRPKSASAGADTEPEPEPEPDESVQLLPNGTAVIVSGLVSASAAKHNGRSGRVLRYDEKKGRYAVQLDPSGHDRDGTQKLLVRPECLLEDLDAEVESDGNADQHNDEAAVTGSAAPKPPPVRTLGVLSLLSVTALQQRRGDSCPLP